MKAKKPLWNGPESSLQKGMRTWPDKKVAPKGLLWPRTTEDDYVGPFGLSEWVMQARCPICHWVLIPRMLADGPRYCCQCPPESSP